MRPKASRRQPLRPACPKGKIASIVKSLRQLAYARRTDRVRHLRADSAAGEGDLELLPLRVSGGGGPVSVAN